MKLLKIQASPKQVSRLRNGHRVRIKQAMEGSGINLLVDPSKFDNATRSFARGSAYQIQLTPDEIMANKQAETSGEMQGEGIHGGKIKIGKAFKKFGRAAKKGLEKAGKTTLKGLEKAGKTTLKGLQTAEKAVRKNPVAREIVKTALPMLAEEGVKAGLTYMGLGPVASKIGSKIANTSTKAGLKKAGYGLYAGQHGSGMYAGAGMCCGGALLGPPSRMPEVSSLAVGGTLLASRDGQLPPALRSDPMGANFHMSTQLPVQLQRCKFV